MKEPLPLLVPANTSGTFSCKALCVGFQCSAFWIIDGVQHGAVNEPGMWSHFDIALISKSHQTFKPGGESPKKVPSGVCVVYTKVGMVYTITHAHACRI